MCDRVVLGRYLCADCWNELLAYKRLWPEAGVMVNEVAGLISTFFDTPVGTYVPARRSTAAGDVDAEFARLTKQPEQEKS
jgi:hypothetical protein